MGEARAEPRKPCGGQYSLSWRGRDGRSHSAEALGLDISPSGVGIECSCELNEGCLVHVRARNGSLNAKCEVVHCTRRGAGFHIGFELRDEEGRAANPPAEHDAVDREPDHYEVLQIHSKADAQTIHRVYRMMAARFHPDNPETADLEQFLRMKRAYAVLSDPARRMEYDAILEKNREAGPRPVFALKDFVTGVKAESNRRLGVLSLLYNQRQINPEHPGVSLLDLEREMGFPREYLAFTMWYLRAKEFVCVADNSDYALTAAGADYVERKAGRNAIVGKLLNASAVHFHSAAAPSHTRPRKTGEPDPQFLLPAASAISDAD